MDFHADIVSALISYFTSIDPRANIDVISPSIPIEMTNTLDPIELKKNDMRYKSTRLLERLLSFKMRHITLVRRNVLFSQELRQKLGSNEYVKFAPVIEEIKIDFQRGNDVNGRLSKLADRPEKDDAMLYEWNMHHLHLGEEKEANGSNYYIRTGELLIVYIDDTEKKVYFVDITENHKNNSVTFSRQRYLDILQRNWPEILSKYELPETHLTEEITDEQRSLLRKNNVVTLNCIGGKTFLNPGIGVTSSGTSIQIIRKTDSMINRIDDVESHCRENQKRFIPKQIPEYLNYRLEFNAKAWTFNILEYYPRKKPKIIYKIYI